MQLPCTLVILTHTNTPLAWLDEHVPAFEQVLIWHDADALMPPPTVPSSVRVEKHSLANNFAAHRNAALSAVQTPWCLFLDQDEWFAAELCIELEEYMKNDSVDAIIFRRYDVFLGRQLTHGEVGAGRFLRAARTHLAQNAWVRPVHEVWQVDVPAARQVLAQTPLQHQSAETYRQFLAKLHRYAQLEPLSRPPQALWYTQLQFLLWPTGKLLQNYVWRQGWRDGWAGLVHALSMSLYSAMTRVFLYERDSL